MSDFASPNGLQLLMWLGIAAFVALVVTQWIGLRRRHAQLTVAVDNLAQGLCLWSMSGKLILCNRRYIEMYDLSPELAKPGATLRQILQRRIDAGTFTGNPEQYIADLLGSMADGKTVTMGREHKGRYIAVVNSRLQSGGWVATHEDITERRTADQQRTAMKEQEKRRATVDTALASFRERVESVLGVVTNGVSAMRDTANDLFRSSERTSQQASTAVSA